MHLFKYKPFNVNDITSKRYELSNADFYLLIFKPSKHYNYSRNQIKSKCICILIEKKS